MEYRILACGDNHGDTESLAKIAEETEGEEFDFIIHTGDITNAYKKGLKTGVDQLKSVEPYFETLAERGTLVYIYGNRDIERALGGSSRHITDKYDLSVGHRLSVDEGLTVNGQRFTTDPTDAGPEDILLTHGMNQKAFFQSSAYAYFCGDTHRARQFKKSLNTGYLHNDNGFNGSYFISTLDKNEIEVTVHGLDEPWKEFICPNHQWYGRQYTPKRFGCRLCKFSPNKQFSRIYSLSFREAVGEKTSDATASVQEIVSEARDMFINSEQFAEQFQQYLVELAEDETRIEIE